MASMNVLVNTFPGLGLPSTLCLQVPEGLSCSRIHALLTSLLPTEAASSTVVLGTNGRPLALDDTSIAQLAARTCAQSNGASFLSLRLTSRLIGGKGGFGSQLRAAGGRMSSKKKRENAELASGSARNLDGRRLRTVTEAKNLATYLATKPDMDRKEKEERKKRWEQVVALAEQREADMRAGKVNGRNLNLSSEWIDAKEDITKNIKNAVELAMAEEKDGKDTDQSNESATDSEEEESDDEDPMDLDEDGMARLRKEAENGDADALWVLQHRLKIPKNMLPKPKASARRFAGFDDDDDVSDEDEDDHEDQKAS